MKNIPLQMIVAFQLQIRSLQSFNAHRLIAPRAHSPASIRHDGIKICFIIPQRLLSASRPTQGLGVGLPNLMAASSSLESSTQPVSHADNRRLRIGVIGGGASGMFSATAAADAVQRYISEKSTQSMAGCDVVVFEGTSKTMSKVRISGGGRCNGKFKET